MHSTLILRSTARLPFIRASAAIPAGSTAIPAKPTPAQKSALITRQTTTNVPSPALDPFLDYFVRVTQSDGNRLRARMCLSTILLELRRMTNQNPLPLLRQAVVDVSPDMRLVSTKRGAKIIKTPLALNEKQRTRRGIVALVKAAGSGKDHSFGIRVAKECLKVAARESSAVKSKLDLHHNCTVARSNIRVLR